MGGLAGITEYQPSEYTFTALAGTPLGELAQVLAGHGQAIPFDPLLVKAGSTLGGATAAGLAGPGRFRFGGIRDFILGIRYVDGAGQLIRAGSRVVKNAAGFDLPKFMVGSLGRLGVLYELTFKVFPTTAERLSLRVRCTDHRQATGRLIEAARARWELAALDYLPSERWLLLQLAGPQPAIGQIAADIGLRWPGDVEPIEPSTAAACWETIRGLGIPQPEVVPDGTGMRGTGMGGNGADEKGPFNNPPVVIQIVLTPTLLPDLQLALAPLEDVHVHYSVGGNVATVVCRQPREAAALGYCLTKLRLTGMVLAGPDAPLWLGVCNRSAIGRAIQTALDPQHRFPPFASPTPR